MFNQNLATTNTENFTITTNGDGFISQGTLGELCGVSQHALSQHISKLVIPKKPRVINELSSETAEIVETRDTLNFNEKNQLHYSNVAQIMEHYAFDSQRTNETALKNYRMLAKAGAKAYIYHLAGYTVEAVKPKSEIELLVASANALLKLEQNQQQTQALALEASNTSIEVREEMSKFSATIKEKAAQEVIPPKGFMSINTASDTFAHLMPKSHIRGILTQTSLRKYVESMQCTKYIPETNTMADYKAYRERDIYNLIETLIVTGVKHNKTKIKSPLYNQAFKHPMY